MSNYKVFKRSATNWGSFVAARKFHICWCVDAAQARQVCAEFNDNRNSAQIKKGTKYEYTSFVGRIGS